MNFNCFLVYIFKKLIVSLVFQQICKKDNCNHTFPFKIPLLVFSEQGIFMLDSWQKSLYSFTCGSYGARTSINFDQILNAETLRYLRKREIEMFELSRLQT